MIVNEGSGDRVIRVVLALLLGFLAYQGVGGPVGEWIFGILGAISFITAITGFCLIYRLVGIRTCPLPTNNRAGH